MFESNVLFFTGEIPFTRTEVLDAVVAAANEARAVEELSVPLHPNVMERAVEDMIGNITARTRAILDQAIPDGKPGIGLHALSRIRAIASLHVKDIVRHVLS